MRKNRDDIQSRQDVIMLPEYKNLIYGISEKKDKTMKFLKNKDNGKIKLNRKNFNSKLSDIFIHIGAHLQKCHFEVKNDLLLKFKKYKNAIIKKDDKVFIDLSLIIKTQLLEQKILEKNIRVSEECSFCLNDKYFSYRRDKPKNIQAMVAYIGINN